jgi:hypothetical protein
MQSWGLLPWTGRWEPVVVAVDVRRLWHNNVRVFGLSDETTEGSLGLHAVPYVVYTASLRNMAAVRSFWHNIYIIWLSSKSK